MGENRDGTLTVANPFLGERHYPNLRAPPPRPRPLPKTPPSNMATIKFKHVFQIPQTIAHTKQVNHSKLAPR